MKMQLHNTLSRTTEPLEPKGSGGSVGIYTCGPTVYNYQHIGNFRMYVFEDALVRTLRRFYGPKKVTHVMNITDVGHLVSDEDEGEDKMEVGAAREGKTAREIADLYTRAFFDDAGKLNILKPDVVCPATDHIPEQIGLIKRLEEKGFTYKTSDGMYFDTSKYNFYGELAGTAHMAGIKAGARVRANPEKRGASDFALWKFSPKDQKRHMEWDSPWGVGFPGWHIECSAMSMKYLGETFDIHCGGVEHIPVHHTNEIAQSEAATGKRPWVRFWLHGEWLLMNKAKMAKSAGGFIRVPDLEGKGFHPLDYRYFCFGAHYRKQLDFSWEALEAAKTARNRLRERALELKSSAPAKPEGELQELLAKFDTCLADDLNLPEALAVLHEAVSKLRSEPDGVKVFLERSEEILALGLFDEPEEAELAPEDKERFDRYVDARKRKDFAVSDALRKELGDRGIRVKDTPAGSVWSRK